MKLKSYNVGYVFFLTIITVPYLTVLQKVAAELCFTHVYFGADAAFVSGPMSTVV